jgi:hypothetical protein
MAATWNITDPLTEGETKTITITGLESSPGVPLPVNTPVSWCIATSYGASSDKDYDPTLKGSALITQAGSLTIQVMVPNVPELGYYFNLMIGSLLWHSNTINPGTSNQLIYYLPNVEYFEDHILVLDTGNRPVIPPSTFSFTGVSGSEIETWVSASAFTTVTGLQSGYPLQISSTGGKFEITGLGTDLTSYQGLSPGNSISIKPSLLSSPNYGAPVSTTITINGVSATFTVTAKTKPLPASMEFKTLIFNRNKNNTYIPFVENFTRKGRILFSKNAPSPLNKVAKLVNSRLYPAPTGIDKPALTEEGLRTQPKFDPTVLNSIDLCGFKLKEYSPYIVLNVSNIASLDGNYIIALDSDYTTQSNAIFDTMKKANTYSHTPDYRCLYLKNTHPSDMALQVGIYIADQPSAKDVLEVGLDPVGINGVAQTIANSTTAPSGVTFSAATYDNPVVVGTLLPGESIAFWIKRYSTENTEAPSILDISRIAYKALV